MKDLGTLGVDNGEAFAIKDEGVVIGRADVTGNGAHHAFLGKQGSCMKDFGNPQGDTCTTALSINASNLVLSAALWRSTGGGRFKPVSADWPPE